MTMRVQCYVRNSELVEILAQSIATALRQAIVERGNASIAVSGGSTPKSLFAALSQADIEWSKVTVTLVDERWVPQTHRDSNAKLVHEHLLCNRAAKAKFIALKTSHDDPFAAESTLDAVLKSKVLPLDVVVLGMGEDGHTASYFPLAQGLAQALQSHTHACFGVRPTTASHERMTLSLATVLAAKNVFLHIIGEKKKSVLEAAMLAGPVTELPVRAVLHQSKVPLQIFYAEQE